MISLALDSWVRFYDPSGKQALSPIRKLLFTTKIWVPLLRPDGYLAMLVIVVIHRLHSSIEVLMPPSPLPPPMAACITSFSMMKASPQGRGFYVNSDPLDLEPEYNRVLTSISRREPNMPSSWIEFQSVFFSYSMHKTQFTHQKCITQSFFFFLLYLEHCICIGDCFCYSASLAFRASAPHQIIQLGF